ncbi:MFS transporter [Klebsiella pneumoniae]|nr:MFS transporter [Klebsiella pneumoniae]
MFGSFFFGYAVFNFIGGLAVDKFGAPAVMGLAVGLWSTVLRLNHGSHTGFIPCWCWVLSGWRKATICASANKMINGWFPKKASGCAVGFLSAGSPLGGAVAGPIVSYVRHSAGAGFYDYFRYRYCMDDSVVFIAANSPEKHKKVSQGKNLSS